MMLSLPLFKEELITFALGLWLGDGPSPHGRWADVVSVVILCSNTNQHHSGCKGSGTQVLIKTTALPDRTPGEGNPGPGGVIPLHLPHC